MGNSGLRPQLMRDTPNRLILDIQALQTRAHALHMPRSAKALNDAMNAAGWELADSDRDPRSQEPPK